MFWVELLYASLLPAMAITIVINKVNSILSYYV